MSKLLINRYYSDVDKVFQFGKTKNEGSISIAFYNLLNEYARRQHYEVIHQASCVGTHGKSVRPDGILKNAFGLNIGLWESKDEKDTIDDEIDVKQKKGYPFYNILFEDSQTAVLIQRGEEVMRAPVRDAPKLHDIITEFICYKSDKIHDFEKALDNFLEWILDQYKEKKPKDPTIAEKFNTYLFADYKDHVIDLLKRVCTVSVATMKVVREMEKKK